MKWSHNTLRVTVMAVAFLGLTSCKVPVKTFAIDAIDPAGKSVKCLVVLDYDWPAADAKDVLYTPAMVPIEFKKKRVRVQVKPANVGPDGSVVAVPQRTDPSEYQVAEREVELQDPVKQLFIVTHAR